MRNTIQALTRRAKRVLSGNGKDEHGRRSPWPRVVIVGAGFAGLEAAKTLGGEPVEVTLLDRNNYHKFQPLLYQVATAGLEPNEIARNVRDIFTRYPNIHVKLGTVERIDTRAQRLRARSGEEISYDYLILAAGAVTSYFGVEGAREHSFPLKNVPDAMDLRNHVLRQFERYDRDPDGAGAGALTFVVVGGGPTGVETAGALTELFRVMQDNYKQFDTEQAQVYLVEMGPQLLEAYDASQGAYTRRVLEGRGVRVMTDTTVERVEEDRVHLKGGRSIATRTLIWGAGVQGSPVAALLDVETTEGGRLPVNQDLGVPGHPAIFAAGDLSAAKDDEGETYAQLAPVAIQQGRHAAQQILRLERGEETQPFHYRDLGKMATIGRNAAVAELPFGLRFNGFLAWFAWVTIHIFKLVGFRNRASVFASWIYNYFTYDRAARLILDMVPISDEVPHEVEFIDAELRERMLELGQEGV